MQAAGKFPVHKFPGPCILADEQQGHGGIPNVFFSDAPHDVVVVFALDQFIHRLIAAYCPCDEYVAVMIKGLYKLVNLLLIVVIVGYERLVPDLICHRKTLLSWDSSFQGRCCSLHLKV